MCSPVYFYNNLLAADILLIAVIVIAHELLTQCFNTFDRYAISMCSINNEKTMFYEAEIIKQVFN